MDWWPRHTPRSGTPAAAAARTSGTLMPASRGVHGPGEMTTATGCSARAPSTLRASFR